MTDTLEPLVRDLVQWCAREPRRYDDVLEAWRTSCPRLMVWEEAVARGLVVVEPGGPGLMVAVTARGRSLAAVVAAAAKPAPPAAARPL